jgi:hypothetical protein
LGKKIDSVIDLATSSPENKELLTDRLGRLRKEKAEIESRLTELAETPAHFADPEAVVDTILAGLADAQTLFEHGTMEERKRVIRAFVEGIRLDAASGSAEITTKELPEPDLLGAGSCLNTRTARTSWPGRFCVGSGGPLRSPKEEEGEGDGGREGEVHHARERLGIGRGRVGWNQLGAPGGSDEPLGAGPAATQVGMRSGVGLHARRH